jgi:hypothetical protein
LVLALSSSITTTLLKEPSVFVAIVDSPSSEELDGGVNGADGASNVFFGIPKP